MKKNYYVILGVTADASSEEIRAAFRRQTMEAHPDQLGLESGRFQDVSLAESFEVYHPSFDELFERLWSNFDMFDRPKAERLESLTVEILVGPDEARLGGRVRVRIPARAMCSVCGGHGAVGSYECWRCEGHGSLTTEHPVEVAYPAGMGDGYAVRIPLTRFGIENFYLTVLFRVGGGGQ
jgi:hypothetical protein